MSLRNWFSATSRTHAVLLALLIVAGNVSAAEWKEKVLYSFQGGNDGAMPSSGVVFDKAGNLYGTTLQGGVSSCPPAACGTVFRLSPPANKGDPWTETVLYVFKGRNYSDGSSPAGGVVLDAAGNLYGTTGYGGSGSCELFGTLVGCGTVFELSPPPKNGDPWTERVLYSFLGGKDGYLPGGVLTWDQGGNLYGATDFGGGYGTCNKLCGFCGTVFKLSPPKTKGGKWREKVLHSFKGGTDGANPNGGLLLGGKDTIYGTTALGGGTSCQNVGCGTAFELYPPKAKGGAWTEEILHRFTDGNDGVGPNGGLVSDTKGGLYGTTGGGGGHAWGTVFELSPPNGLNQSGGWTENLLHVFNACGRYDPCEPNAGLIFDSAGDLYGIAGVIFRMKPPVSGGEWKFSILHTFTGPPDGFDPIGLILDSSGTIYGATLEGGIGQACQGGCGTVFETKP